MATITENELQFNTLFFNQFGTYANFCEYMASMANPIRNAIEKTPALVKYVPKSVKKDERSTYKFVHESKEKAINDAKFQFHLTKIRYNIYYDRSKKKYCTCLALRQIYTNIQRRWLFGEAN